VPVLWLFTPQMPLEAGPQPPGTPGAADVEVVADGQAKGAQAANANIRFAAQMQDQYVCAWWLHAYHRPRKPCRKSHAGWYCTTEEHVEKCSQRAGLTTGVVTLDSSGVP